MEMLFIGCFSCKLLSWLLIIEGQGGELDSDFYDI